MLVVYTREYSLLWLPHILFLLPPAKSPHAFVHTLPPVYFFPHGLLNQSLEKEASSFETRLNSARADLQKADHVRDSLDRSREQDEVKGQQQVWCNAVDVTARYGLMLTSLDCRSQKQEISSQEQVGFRWGSIAIDVCSLLDNT